MGSITRFNGNAFRTVSQMAVYTQNAAGNANYSLNDYNEISTSAYASNLTGAETNSRTGERSSVYTPGFDIGENGENIDRYHRPYPFGFVNENNSGFRPR